MAEGLFVRSPPGTVTPSANSVATGALAPYMAQPRNAVAPLKASLAVSLAALSSPQVWRFERAACPLSTHPTMAATVRGGCAREMVCRLLVFFRLRWRVCAPPYFPNMLRLVVHCNLDLQPLSHNRTTTHESACYSRRSAAQAGQLHRCHARMGAPFKAQVYLLFSWQARCDGHTHVQVCTARSIAPGPPDGPNRCKHRGMLRCSTAKACAVGPAAEAGAVLCFLGSRTRCA